MYFPASNAVELMLLSVMVSRVEGRGADGLPPTAILSMDSRREYENPDPSVSGLSFLLILYDMLLE